MKSLLTVRLISALNEPQHTLVLQKLKVEKEIRYLYCINYWPLKRRKKQLTNQLFF